MKTKKYAYSALFAVLIAAASQMSIPVRPVPVNLATLAILLSGLILGAKYGLLSVVVYILLGCVGVPVFSSFRGGLSVLTGMTGGYIAGFLPMVLIVGFVSQHTKQMFAVVISMIAGIILCYVLGTVWFCMVTMLPVEESIYLCIIPYIPGDVIKILAALYLFRKIKYKISNHYLM